MQYAPTLGHAFLRQRNRRISYKPFVAFAVFVVLTGLLLGSLRRLHAAPPTSRPTQRTTAPPTSQLTQRTTVPPTSQPTKRTTVPPTSQPTKRTTASPTSRPAADCLTGKPNPTQPPEDCDDPVYFPNDPPTSRPSSKKRNVPM